MKCIFKWTVNLFFGAYSKSLSRWERYTGKSWKAKAYERLVKPPRQGAPPSGFRVTDPRGRPAQSWSVRHPRKSPPSGLRTNCGWGGEPLGRWGETWGRRVAGWVSPSFQGCPLLRRSPGPSRALSSPAARERLRLSSAAAQTPNRRPTCPNGTPSASHPDWYQSFPAPSGQGSPPQPQANRFPEALPLLTSAARPQITSAATQASSLPVSGRCCQSLNLRAGARLTNHMLPPARRRALSVWSGKQSYSSTSRLLCFALCACAGFPEGRALLSEIRFVCSLFSPGKYIVSKPALGV